MGIRNDASSPIVLVYWDRRRLPAGRQGRPDTTRQAETPNYQFAPIIFLSLLPTGKVADNLV